MYIILGTYFICVVS